ncbi:alpha/beta hydrolase [Opitutus terrae]|uniref:Putative esterase n=1 Tax=Opitutus terrae (strain DSM 11246 / JCM 15787 / PB90-1) TaxID=452637 RepID=B1ZYZ7_OPITP|nr:alpha/beta hydrolase-fold protein [Opitutus terrae]ACB76320.1 putative esterase [Opitutus terrae PB90-1]
MKSLAAFLFLAPLLLLPVTRAAEAPAAYSIPGSQVRNLPVNSVSGRAYQLLIGLPGNYDKDTTKRYPVVFVTDGYWDFAKLTSIHGGLVYDHAAPEFITVGLSYVGEKLNYGDLRWWELSPVVGGGKGPEESGHAADFLKILENEIVPFVEREYRVDSAHRALAGASLGGLFTLYAMYTTPDFFSGYIAATPAIAYTNDWLLGYEEEFAKAGKKLNTRLFVSVGEKEWSGHIAGILRHNERLASRKHAGLAYQFRIIDGEGHAGMQFESYTRGLRFILGPLATPPTMNAAH